MTKKTYSANEALLIVVIGIAVGFTIGAILGAGLLADEVCRGEFGWEGGSLKVAKTEHDTYFLTILCKKQVEVLRPIDEVFLTDE